MADPRIHPSEITPPAVYFNRRNFLRGGAVAAGAVATGLLYRRWNTVELAEVNTAAIDGVVAAPEPAAGDTSGFHATDRPNSLSEIAHYNTFSECTTDKDGVARAAAGFDPTGWTVEVGGLVGKPRTFDLDDLRRLSPPEERIYRMRCVEAWSMVIPWVGYSLSKLLNAVEPRGDARFVAFETLHDPRRMPGQRGDVLPWPYVEGLRMDEAMHPLAILATGLYGRELPPQDGAPIRLVTPWKYGFKGIKSIVKITVVAEQPPATWNRAAPDEYGFYANVNPKVDHPRWSQATEQRIGEDGRRATLMFNGYADQVASLYAGQDLRVDF